MKIGILTHYTVINQGAILQMIAMQNWLKENGHDCYILKYTKDFDFAPNEAGKYNLSIKYFPFYFKEYVLKKGIRLSWFNVKKQLMYKNYMKRIFEYRNYALDQMDAVIVGSDEVFSLECGCNMMMYGHGVNTEKLISYAPSFGQTDLERINKFHCKELIRSGLEKFDYLSVRDKSSAKIVKELINKEPCLVCDPVLLYDFSNINTKVKKKIKKDYLLVYSYDRWMTDPAEIKAIKEYAKTKNLLTVSAGTYHKWCDINIVCNPLEWLEYFRGATEIITDTFHGSILSIITNKPTAYFIRSNNSNKIYDLLEDFGLLDRLMKRIDIYEINRVLNTPLKNKDINEHLNELRKRSEAFLRTALDEHHEN